MSIFSNRKRFSGILERDSRGVAVVDRIILMVGRYLELSSEGSFPAGTVSASFDDRQPMLPMVKLNDYVALVNTATTRRREQT